MREEQSKFTGVAEICGRLEALDAKLEEQAMRLDQVQVKVNLSCDTLGKVQQEQVQAGKQSAATPEAARPAPRAPPPPNLSDGLLGAAPGSTARSQNRHNQVPNTSPYPSGEQGEHIQCEDATGKRNWMPKMDFPKFDGTGVRIWLDQCESFFLLYSIPENFRVTSASLNLVGNAAHWFQSFKQSGIWPTWQQFCEAVIEEFDVNVHRELLQSLMRLKQVGTVEEYKSQFHQLVYNIRLYEPALSDTLLVTRFIMGLKEELRAAVEMQLPATVQKAAVYAMVQERLINQTKGSKTSYQKVQHNKQDNRNSFAPGELWKARQLKEYRRANG